MKRILFLLLGFSCSTLALESNPTAPPAPNVVDRFGVNLQTGQLSRKLNTVSIGGELGLSHSVQLYTDFLSDGNNGFVDAFAGKISRTRISENIIDILTNGSGDTLMITALRDKATHQPDYTQMVHVMRVYGPAGSQDFLVYKNGVVNRDALATSGQTYKAVGDYRHSLIESADKSYYIWTTPDGIESKYSSYGMRLVEVTYPNGFKIRVNNTDVTTNTGFMLKYQLQTISSLNTFNQIVAINLAHQYCASTAETCPIAGWPSATFTWPAGTPSVFRLPGSSYSVKMTTPAGVTDIQYVPENICIKEGGSEDADCAAHPLGGTKWYPRLRSIRTPESTVPNYQYTYKNKGQMYGNTQENQGTSYGYTWWSLAETSGQIISATLNGTDSQGYGGSTNSYNATVTWGNGETWVESSLYEPNVIESVIDKKSGTYKYVKDLRNFVDEYYPVTGRGPAQKYFYNGPRGNLNQIKSIAPSTPMTLQEVEYVETGATCALPKVCNKPARVKDAKGNVTTYDYDPEGRFGNPIKITRPDGKAATVYTYTQQYAYYKRNGEAITQDPDPIWMLSSEHTCRTSNITDTGCTSGELDTVKTNYYYGPQDGSQANNLLLRGKSVTGEGTPSVLETHVWCYEYDKYGKLMGETTPRGNSTNLQSCQ